MIYQITTSSRRRRRAPRRRPEALDAIVQRAMAKDLARRYGNWGELPRSRRSSAPRTSARARAQEFADSDRFETLRRLPFFEHFSDAELWEVVRISTWRHAPAGETLMKEGEPGDYFCILAQGEVKVTKRGRLLNVLRAGEPFGEMAYLSQGERRVGRTSPRQRTRASSPSRRAGSTRPRRAAGTSSTAPSWRSWSSASRRNLKLSGV